MEITWNLNTQKQGVEIRFSERPDYTVLETLKANGWRWSGFGKCWYRKDNPEARTYAETLAGEASVVAPAPARPTRGSNYTRFSSGAEVYTNTRGRCEDAPCCGCCT